MKLLLSYYEPDDILRHEEYLTCLLENIRNELIEEIVINQGDCSMTFVGGHTYTILEEDTVVYEYKTGPYQGQKLDKVFLED